MAKNLTPARFVALYELSINPGPTGHLNKRTAKALIDAGLIEWCDTTPRAQVYRATPAGVEATRNHLAFLAKREKQGLLFRSNAEQQYQANTTHHLENLEKATSKGHPETSADRIAKITKENS